MPPQQLIFDGHRHPIPAPDEVDALLGHGPDTPKHEVNRTVLVDVATVLRAKCAPCMTNLEQRLLQQMDPLTIVHLGFKLAHDALHLARPLLTARTEKASDLLQRAFGDDVRNVLGPLLVADDAQAAEVLSKLDPDRRHGVITSILHGLADPLPSRLRIRGTVTKD